LIEEALRYKTRLLSSVFHPSRGEAKNGFNCVSCPSVACRRHGERRYHPARLTLHERSIAAFRVASDISATFVVSDSEYAILRVAALVAS
jgi:hypothetical protein